MAWVSSAEAQRFVEVVNATVNSIQNQGKFDCQANALQLEAAEMTVSGETIRWMVGKEVEITTKGDVYGRQWDQHSFETVLDQVLEREYQKNLIYQAIQEGCAAPRDISQKVGLNLRQISYLLADMEKTNMVEFKGMEACKPVFAAL